MQLSEPDQEFPDFDSTAKLLGFLCREYGAKVLREVLALKRVRTRYPRLLERLRGRISL